MIDSRAMCLEVRSAAPLSPYGQTGRACLGPLVWWSWAVGEGCMPCSMRMHTADRSAAPDERVGLCTCPEHAACTWHTCTCTCHAGLRASRDRRCPLAPVCAWTDTGVTGRVLSLQPSRVANRLGHKDRASRDRRCPFARTRAPHTHLGPMGSAAYGLGVARCLLPAFAHVFCPLWARYTVPLMGDGYRAVEASVPGQRLHSALQVLQVPETRSGRSGSVRVSRKLNLSG